MVLGVRGWGLEGATIRYHGRTLTKDDRHLMSRRAIVATAALLAIASCGGGDTVSPTAAPAPQPVTQSPPKAVDAATIAIKSTGFVLDKTSAAFFSLSDLHIYQGATLTFVNEDFQP